MKEGKKQGSGRIIERVAGAPAMVLEETIEEGKKVADVILKQKPVQKAKGFWHLLGPGLTTGASDDDPSGIGTYSQAGAKFGYNLLWLSPLTFPLMAVIQEMCARIGLVTGRGLAANIKIHFPRWVLYCCTIALFVANTFNIGANFGAMAEATKLIIPRANPTLAIIIIALFSIGLQVFYSYAKYAKYLKWLALILLSYIVSTLLITDLSWREILSKAVSPMFEFSRDYIIFVCAILGTTISPYLFFWQTSQEVEEEIEQGRTTIRLRQSETTNEEINNMRVDVWSGMFLSNLVMFFIVVACAATLNRVGITNISTAAEAAEALRPLAGESSYFLFALGIIGTGLLAVPILSGSASYAISESLGWKGGLHRPLKQASAFYGVIIISVLIGLAINFIGLNPIYALFYSAVLNGLVAPIVLILIVLIGSNKKVMGERVNGLSSKALGWVVTVLMSLAALFTLYFIIFP